MRKNIKLEIKINESIKIDIITIKPFSVAKTINIDNITIDMEITYEYLSYRYNKVYNLQIQITNQVDGKIYVSKNSKQINNYEEIYNIFRIYDFELDVVYFISIEYDYENDKYLNYFRDFRSAYFDEYKFLERINCYDFNKNKNVIKACNLIIGNSDTLLKIPKTDIKFLLDKFYYYGFEELGLSSFKFSQTVFKTDRELFDAFVSTAIIFLNSNISKEVIHCGEEWIDNIYNDERNKIILDKLMTS